MLAVCHSHAHSLACLSPPFLLFSLLSPAPKWDIIRTNFTSRLSADSGTTNEAAILPNHPSIHYAVARMYFVTCRPKVSCPCDRRAGSTGRGSKGWGSRRTADNVKTKGDIIHGHGCLMDSSSFLLRVNPLSSGLFLDNPPFSMPM